MIQAPRGTRDVLPSQSSRWQHIESVMREECRLAGFHEIRTPVFEHTELFLRGVGETTDIVQKEMYTFEDKGGRSITLQPEGTAGAVRLFLEHGLFNEPLPLKMYYLYCPVFRYEAPQAGRFREHHQFGVEAFGAPSPSMDAEIIALGAGIVRRLGLKDLELHVNSIGCPQCRPSYQEALREFLRPRLPRLCGSCNERFSRNPLRILDCKVPSCQEELKGAPVTLDYLCEDCSGHFEALKIALQKLGVPFVIDTGLVRGLDYYTKTVFEMIAALPDGGHFTTFGGGRYDGLVELIGGPPTAGIGFGLGMERILSVMEGHGLFEGERSEAPGVFIASMGQEAALAALTLAQSLRESCLSADMDHAGRSLKAQFKYAGRLGSPYVVVIGENELQSGKYTLRDMQSKEEVALSPAELIETLKKGALR
ncbi:MAG: histidine--tRNA ligase [Christensenellaceae bacterium]|jgi:histidyl-tRNA synthetase|nr:histidine--tRNA ligase [Christensenellaceae bacterium]